MKKTIPFELFEKGQEIYFDIPRLAELEKAVGLPINMIVTKQETGIGFCLIALRIGLKHHYRKATEDFYAEKMETHFDNDGTLEDIIIPIIRAIMASGIFGKEAIAKIEKKVAADADNEEDANQETTEKNA
jgi:hypothetical protein